MYLRDMWCMSDRDKERKHDYIQWMLPTNQKSEFNRRAPVLSKNDIETLKADELVMKNMRKSVSVFLEFLGFRLADNDTVCLGNDFEYKVSNWLRPRNHNYKRITRLLRFLKLFEFDVTARSLMVLLESLYQGNKEIIGETTYNYWKETVYLS